MKCGDCKKTFKYTPHPRYPRKYCDSCSKERADYTNGKA